LVLLRSEVGVDQLTPGLTGWAQVNGRDSVSVSEKVALDLEYLQKRSFQFDLYILWLTFLRVISTKDISH
jgi:O-antigen biosynthesis protein WbqP